MLKNRDIIITGLQSWDIEIGSTCKNIARSFAKNNRVLYVSPPYTRLSRLKNQSYKHHPDKLIKVAENIHVLYPDCVRESIGRLSINWLFDILNKKNNRIFAHEIKSAIEMLNFKNYIHFCDGDLYQSLYLKEYLKPLLYVYLFRDNILAVDYWKAQGKRIQSQHMAKADIIFTNSYYHNDIASEHNKHSYFAGQGCDLEMYNRDNVHEIPADIRSINSPIIGYTGVLTSIRLDITIIEHMAKARPDWNIVLVGPEDEDFKNSNLHNIPNVHFFGRKDPEGLAAYINAFDLAINPQLVNEMTIGNYPLKIDEYLAMGKPVLATSTKAMEYFAEYSYLANNKEEYVELAERALKEDNEEKAKSRILYARGHSWDNMVAIMSEYIEKHLPS
ncbi:MAG: glycosyltransferase [Bacteroidales bacterium]